MVSNSLTNLTLGVVSEKISASIIGKGGNLVVVVVVVVPLLVPLRFGVGDEPLVEALERNTDSCPDVGVAVANPGAAMVAPEP